MTNIDLIALHPHEACMLILAENERFDVILMGGAFGFDFDLGDNGIHYVTLFRAVGVTTHIVMFSSSNFFNSEGRAAGATAEWNKNNLWLQSWEDSLYKVLTAKT
ncbi:MAG: hypothetical protein NUW00_02030 [Candidatus Kaiserbacteria bacterium]|nr:hypothetical protein [Candidatus Kaiserbacteria bacterium]